MTVGLAHDARLGRDVEVDPAAVADHELGRAAADVEDERRASRSAGSRSLGGAEVRQPRLLIAGQDVRLQPEARATTVGELRAVGGVADGARHHRDRASAPPWRSISCAVLVEHRVLPRIASSAQPAAASTPAPSRVTPCAARARRRRSCRRSTSARSSRVELVPMSTTAIAHVSRSAARGPGTAAAGRRGRRACSRRRSPSSARARPRWPSRCAGPPAGSAPPSSGSSGGSGSGSVTSSAAPAISPVSSASRSASWSTIGPRAVLIRIAVGFISASAAASIRWRVPASAGSGSRRSPSGASSVLEAAGSDRASRSCSTVHAEPGGAARDRLPDPAEADDPERRAVDVAPEEAGRAPRSATRRRERRRSPRAAGARPPAAARTRGRRWPRSARRACCRPGSRAPPPRRRRCCRSRPRSWRSPAARAALDQLRVDAVGEQAQQPVASAACARAPRSGGSRSGQTRLVSRLQPVERRTGQPAGDEAAGHAARILPPSISVCDGCSWG